MAKKGKRKQTPAYVNWGFVIVCSLLFALAVFITLSTVLDFAPDLGIPTWDDVFEMLGFTEPYEPYEPGSSSDGSVAADGENTPGECRVYVMDVGQADSILVQLEGKNILIDGGLAETADEVTLYLQSLGVKRLDVVVATHMHADHIGGLPQILPNFEVCEVVMTELSEERTPTTAVFERFMDVVVQSEAKVTRAVPGLTWQFGELGELQVLGPVQDKEYDDLNDTSVVCKLTYGSRKFLFTGDSGSQPEKDMLALGEDLSADVLDAGHHGSRTSTSRAFLEAVDPEIVTISCGLDNSYGHPHDETLRRLEKQGARVYRTDLYGTIVLTTDGRRIDVETENEPPAERAA